MDIVYSEEIPVKNQDAYESRLLFLSLRLEIITFIALILLSVTAVSTYTWSVANKEVVHTGIQMGLNTTELKGLYQGETANTYQELTASSEILGETDVFMPGSVINFSIGLYNSQTASFSISRVFLEAPNVWVYGPTSSYPLTENDQMLLDECPIWNFTSETYDYFGKQLTIQVSECKIYSGAVQDAEGTVDLSAAGVTSETFDLENWNASANSFLVNERQPAEVTLLTAPSDGTETMILEPGELVTFELVINFVNDEEKSQNAFMHFGNYKSDGSVVIEDGSNYPGGRCSRSISSDFKEILN